MGTHAPHAWVGWMVAPDGPHPQRDPTTKVAHVPPSYDRIRSPIQWEQVRPTSIFENQPVPAKIILANLDLCISWPEF